MKEQEAKNLVDATFTSSYSEDKFRLFIRNLFSDPEECTGKSSTGKYIHEAFQDGIVSYKRLFKFTDPEDMVIDVLAVKLKNSRTLENARTMQRNFIARYLNGSRGGALKDAALVAFYADDSDEWRFSLVRMDYVLDEEKSKVKKELTPARRFSFLVGGNEKTHTARRQLFPILKGGTETTLTELEQAFNIESVTKEFFEQYKELFLRLTESLDKVRAANIGSTDTHLMMLHIETADLCKKLLGQIVFLYFLQKKGWLGVDKNKKWGTGDKNYLRSLFKKCTDDDDDKFFDNYLEPLFYEALATERDGHYYSRFDCRIPFLNGGLFEPTNNYDWKQYDFNIPNELFSNKNKTKSGDNGDGILDIFDRYNFTVREDESLEKEVAVDPEMLGQVFENLLEVKDRKSKGAFYTPREIVHYMCQESLINYLDAKLNINDQEEYSTKVSKEDITDFIYHGDSFREHDATTKSKGKETGAYPKNIRKNAKVIDKALADVKICDPAIGSGAFPVGIMHEIVRARLTLLESSSIKKTDKTNSYEYKRRAIQQSIYGVDIDESAIEIAKLRLWLSLVIDEVDMDEIKPLPNLTYKIVKGNSLLGIDKGNIFQYPHLKRFEELKLLYFDETNESKKRKYKRDINKIIKMFAKDGQFDFKIFFSEVFSKNGGFDIVIANPPYIQLSKQKDTTKEYKNYLKSRFGTSAGRLNTFIFFIHLGMEYLTKNGALTYIIPNTILTQDYYTETRLMLLRNNELKKIIQYEKMPFENAVVENVTISVTKNTKVNYPINIYSDNLKTIELVSQKDKISLLNNRKFAIDVNSNSLVDRIFTECNSVVDDFCYINQGIALKGDKSLSLRSANDAGDFYKLLDGRNINRYSIKWSDVYLDYNLNKIHSCKRKDIFETKEKLFFRRVSEKLIFAYDNEQYFSLNTLIVVNIKQNSPFSIKCLLAIFNSKLMNYLYKCKFKSTKKVFSEIQARTVKQLPIPASNNKNKQVAEALEALANRILSLKQNNKNIERINLEQETDQLVYQFYDLTPEEIQIIEVAS